MNKLAAWLLYVHSSFAIILMGKRELVALLSLSSWCLMMVVWLFLAVSWVCLRFVIVVSPDHTHLLNFLLAHFDSRSLWQNIWALWSPAGKGLTSWLSFVVSAVSLSLSNW